MDFLQGLNPQQREAVTHIGCPLLILAGAGSGKTRVITHRIAHLIKAHRVPPSAIVAVTFTNKAAAEMQERVHALLGGEHPASSPRISTFHSFCVRLLRRRGDPLASFRPGFTRSFTIYDENDQLSIIKAVYRDLGLDEKFMQYRGAAGRISQAKNSGQAPQDLYRRSADPKIAKLAVIFERYQDALRKANALDFDDLLLESVRLLSLDGETRAEVNGEIQHLLVDEYQDTNRSQYELMRLLTERGQGLCVVGDEDQSIYGWRGADIRNILDFERDYPGARIIRLEQNYRSTQTILEAAGAVVAHNRARKGKRLWTESGAGELITLYQASDGENEALFVAQSIQQSLARDPGERVAVLYRTNAQSRQFEEALRRYSIPYMVVGGFSFYQRAEVRDVLAYLKLMVTPGDPVSLLRIINTPARGIGRTTVEQVEQYAREHGLGLWPSIGRMLAERRFPTRAEAAMHSFVALMAELAEAAGQSPPEAIGLILDRTGYQKMLEADGTPGGEARLENLHELRNAAAEAAVRGESIAEFLDHAALISEADSLDEKARVLLLTLHNAKGLEFPVVFIAGLEDGLFPHSRSLDSPEMMEEERRLFYVGMTRARKRLTLSWARSRRRFGGGQPQACTASRFLQEVPSHLIDNRASAAPISQLDLYSERAEVRETARRNTYTGKTYNSLENIAQFFSSRGLAAPGGAPVAPAPAVPARPAPAPAVRRGGGLRPGARIEHPRFGVGTVVRREGEGDDAKLTVSFPGYGLKKLVAKYAGLKKQE